jgi:hypothetical protein
MTVSNQFFYHSGTSIAVATRTRERDPSIECVCPTRLRRPSARPATATYASGWPETKGTSRTMRPSEPSKTASNASRRRRRGWNAWTASIIIACRSSCRKSTATRRRVGPPRDVSSQPRRYSVPSLAASFSVAPDRAFRDAKARTSVHVRAPDTLPHTSSVSDIVTSTYTGYPLQHLFALTYSGRCILRGSVLFRTTASSLLHCHHRYSARVVEPPSTARRPTALYGDSVRTPK